MKTLKETAAEWLPLLPAGYRLYRKTALLFTPSDDYHAMLQLYPVRKHTTVQEAVLTFYKDKGRKITAMLMVQIPLEQSAATLTQLAPILAATSNEEALAAAHALPADAKDCLTSLSFK